MSTNAPRLWAVVGATGTGKTACSLDLADALAARGRAAEVINADAMQLYRGMDIGTAKLAEHERRGIPHHLFDEVDVTDEATVAWYQRRAREVVRDVQARGADAILVGGSGLYVSSVIYDFSFPPRDPQLRAALEAEAEECGSAPLMERLRQLSPEVAAQVDAHNPRRIIRALEVALLGGDARVTLPAAPRLWQRDTAIVGVRVAREALVQRLDKRVSQMWATGLLDEVRGLVAAGLEQGKTSSQAIGYAQALAELRGEKTEPEAIAETQALTRRYARRQVSWFKRYPDVTWLDGPVPRSEIADLVDRATLAANAEAVSSTLER